MVGWLDALFSLYCLFLASSDLSWYATINELYATYGMVKQLGVVLTFYIMTFDQIR